MQTQAQSNAFSLFTGNPYIAGNPVGHSEAFIGRSDVLAQSMNMLQHDTEHALVLHGQRRIGKTSVLQYLQRQLKDDNGFEVIYFDLQSKVGWSMPQILKELYVVLHHMLNTDSPDCKEVTDLCWLRNMLNRLPSATRLVLLMDEVDVMRSQPPEGFIQFLQSLLTDFGGRVKLMLVIGHSIDEQVSTLQSFLQTLPACRVSLLNKEETVNLVKLSEANDALHWSMSEIDAVWHYTKGHPLLTQQLCAHVWEASYDFPIENASEATPELVASVSEEVLEASRNTLEWSWGGLSLQEKVTAALLAEIGETPVSKAELSNQLRKNLKTSINPLTALKPLQMRDLVGSEDNGETYQIRGELLRSWIAEHKPFRRIKAEFEQRVA
ncbi:MAG: ATP-binding protein [Pseudomonadota bacterium]